LAQQSLGHSTQRILSSLDHTLDGPLSLSDGLSVCHGLQDRFGASKRSFGLQLKGKSASESNDRAHQGATTSQLPCINHICSGTQRILCITRRIVMPCHRRESSTGTGRNDSHKGRTDKGWKQPMTTSLHGVSVANGSKIVDCLGNSAKRTWRAIHWSSLFHIGSRKSSRRLPTHCCWSRGPAVTCSTGVLRSGSDNLDMFASRGQPDVCAASSNLCP